MGYILNTNKAITACIFLLLSTVGSAQFSHRGFPEMFWFRQTTARAEGMAKAYTSLDGDFGSVFVNPAGLATSRQIEVVGTFCRDAGDFVATTDYSYFGVSIPVKSRITLALSSFQFSRQQTLTGAEKPFNNRRTVLTVAMEPFQDFYVGLNTNLLQSQPGYDRVSSTVFLDIGAVKKLRFATGGQQHWLSVGASFVNSTWDRIKLKVPGGINVLEVPAVARVGVSYHKQWPLQAAKDSFPFFRLLIQADFQDLLNSKYQTAFMAGAEGTFFDIFILRGGFFTENVDDYGLPEFNRNRVSKWTYGFGVQLPIYKWLNLPLSARVDYAALPVAKATFQPFDQSNFTSFSANLRWMGALSKVKR